MNENLQEIYNMLTFDDVCSIVREKQRNMAANYVAIGYFLRKTKELELFKPGGYENIHDMARNEFGMARQTVDHCMRVNEKFSIDGYSPRILETYQNFNKSQLQEMLYLTDDQIEDVTPDMTVKEIRETKKAEEIQVLLKPDRSQKEYINTFARKFIECKRGWMIQDFHNRVTDVTRSPEEIKKHLGPGNRTWHFNTDNGVAHINLFDEYVQLWDGNGVCIGNFDWFYLAAAIQSMWNVVSLELAQEQQKQVEDEHLDDEGKCSTSSGTVTACENEAAGICTVHSDEEDRQLCVQEPCQDEELTDAIDRDSCEITEEDEEICEESVDEFAEVSELELAKGELKKAQNLLKDMLNCCEETEVIVRRQKIIVAALAAFIYELDLIENPIPEHEQPELPVMKNNDQRKQWLRNYKDWGLWYEDTNLGVKYYKYDFDNGARLIAEVYKIPGTNYCPEHEYGYLHLVGGPEPKKHPTYGCGKWSYHETYNKYPDSDTELIEFLKEVQRNGEH